MGVAFTILHVMAAILFLGPVTVAVAKFQGNAVEAAQNGNQRAAGAAQTLHKITQTYGNLSILVPGFGFLIMFTGDYWTDPRIIVGIVLSAIAWGILLFLIVPRQRKMLGALGLLDESITEPTDQIDNWENAKKQLSMFGGIFALLWVLTALAMLG